MTLLGKPFFGRCWLVGVCALSLLLMACGRTPLLPPSCDLKIAPAALDFGDVPPGQAVTRELHLTNDGSAECTLSNLGLSANTDAEFSVTTSSTQVLHPQTSVTLSITFQPTSASIPLSRTGEFAADVDSGNLQHAGVPLTAHIRSDCKLDVTPSALDFGHVPLDTSKTLSVRLASSGSGPCEIGNIGLGAATDRQFQLVAANPVILAPGDQQTLDCCLKPRIKESRSRASHSRWTSTSVASCRGHLPAWISAT
jgi:Abnormal spindle-like microcephaly-assoc'd, ASPM-SPD-2-Hydin